MRITSAFLAGLLTPDVVAEIVEREGSSPSSLPLPRLLRSLGPHLRLVSISLGLSLTRSRPQLEAQLLKRSTSWPTAIDLFSGAGGLTVGLKQARYRVLGAVEQDSLSVETYRKNHPEVHLWNRDIQRLPVTQVMRDLDLRKGELDLLAGCPPCQGFSTMKTLNGHHEVNDEQNDLIFEVLRFARGLHPRAIMLENVPGLASDERIETVRRGLEELGYTCRLAVLNAADYGVPQRRRRMIFLAGLAGELDFAKPVAERRSVSQAIKHLPPPKNSADPLHNYLESRHPRVEALIRKIPRDGGSRTALKKKEQLECHQESEGFYDVYGRMAWKGVAPTITSGCINPSKGRFLHPHQHRAITLREAALLQSFPPDYEFSLARGKYPAAQMIGNALPPEFVKRHALEIRRHLRSTAPQAADPS